MTIEKVFTAEMPEAMVGRIITSFDTTVSDPDVNVASYGLTKQLNDNLAQTPITVGGETLSTIDDKLNYLLANKIAINDLLKLYEGNADYTYVPDFNGKMLVILGATSRYSTSFSLIIDGNTVNPLLTSTYANGVPIYTHSNYAIYVVDVEVGQSVTSSVNFGSSSDQAYCGKFEGFYKMQ